MLQVYRISLSLAFLLLLPGIFPGGVWAWSFGRVARRGGVLGTSTRGIPPHPASSGQRRNEALRSTTTSIEEERADTNRNGSVDRTTPSDSDSATRINNNHEPTALKLFYLRASLIKSIVGGGALALPAAVASVGGMEAIPASIFLIGGAATMSAYSFQLVGTVCEQTGATTYLQAWEKTVGSHSKMISAIVSIKTTLACIAYSMILSDSLSSILQVSRMEALIGVTAFVLAPLCLLPNLTALAPYSFVGVLGILLTTLFIVLRFVDGTYDIHSQKLPMDLDTTDVSFALSDGSATVEPPGALSNALASAALQSHDVMAHTDPFALIGLACTLATAFVCHYNCPRIHSELQGSPAVFERLTQSSFAFGAGIMAIIAVIGYMTFGADSAPVILSSYAPDDPLMGVSRLLIVVALIATFPLPFLGLRDSLSDKFPSQSTFTLTVGLLSVISLVAASFTDLGLLLKLGGGTVSMAVAYVIPSLMYLKCDPTAPLPKLLCVVAIAIGITGVTNTLLSFIS